MGKYVFKVNVQLEIGLPLRTVAKWNLNSVQDSFVEKNKLKQTPVTIMYYKDDCQIGNLTSGTGTFVKEVIGNYSWCLLLGQSDNFSKTRYKWLITPKFALLIVFSDWKR